MMIRVIENLCILVLLILLVVIIFKKKAIKIIIISGIIIGAIIGGCKWLEYKFGARESDRISYCAPCWGPNNKIFFIKHVMYGNYSPLLGSIGYYYKKSEIYLCSMNADGTDKKEIVMLEDTSKKPDFIPVPGDTSKKADLIFPRYLDYCSKNGLILMSGGDIPSGGWTNGIWIITPDGSNLTKVSNIGMHASWSPNGKRMVYDGEKGIWVMNIDGTNNHEISQDGGNPIWSPRGDLIAFVCKGWIYTMKPDGSERRKVCDNYLGDWSPDGTMLMTASPRGIIDLNGKSVREFPVEESTNGKWSPDGKMFLGKRDFILYDSVTGKKIGYPLSVGVLRSEGKYFVYKKPNNIW
ncbi:MAG: hypothetical protein AB1422_14900 [bacterium]